MTVMDFPSSPVNGQTTTDGRYYFDSSVGTAGGWRSTPLPVGGLPAGSIMAWGTNTPPANWLLADGSAVSRSVYSSLFAVIGTQYGVGNGTTTFNLPDLRGRVPVGKNGGTFGTLGATGGAETHTLTISEMPRHAHTLNGNLGISAGTPNAPSYSAAANNNTGLVAGGQAYQGGDQPHNNLQPYQVVNYIIKASAGWTAGDSELATRVGALEASGTVVQVVSASTQTQVNITSTSKQATGLTATITPKYSGSKILVTATSTNFQSAANRGDYAVFRNGTELAIGCASNTSGVHNDVCSGTDIPGGTSAITYSFRASVTAGTLETNWAGFPGTITLTEVRA